MASFQMDFDINNLKKIIDTWLGSITRKKIVDVIPELYQIRIIM